LSEPVDGVLDGVDVGALVGVTAVAEDAPAESDVACGATTGAEVGMVTEAALVVEMAALLPVGRAVVEGLLLLDLQVDLDFLLLKVLLLL
jgi:hypothetical protein